MQNNKYNKYTPTNPTKIQIKSKWKEIFEIYLRTHGHMHTRNELYDTAWTKRKKKRIRNNTKLWTTFLCRDFVDVDYFFFLDSLKLYYLSLSSIISMAVSNVCFYWCDCVVFDAISIVIILVESH